MDTVYADDALLTAASSLKEEAELLAYLTEIGSGKRWIHNESARIGAACAFAAKLLIAKNQQLTLLLAERAKWDDLAEEATERAYKLGRRSAERQAMVLARRGGADNE